MKAVKVRPVECSRCRGTGWIVSGVANGGDIGRIVTCPLCFGSKQVLQVKETDND